MLKTTIAAAAALATASTVISFSATPAQAASLVTVDGTDFEVELVTGTFLDLEDQVTATPFWGDSGLAALFATEFNSAVGTRVNGFGPLFAFAIQESQPVVESQVFSQPPLPFLPASVGQSTDFQDVSATFAIVRDTTAVPTPALLPGLLGMGIATLRKRKLT